MGVKVRGVREAKANLNRIIDNIQGAQGCPRFATVGADTWQQQSSVLHADRLILSSE